MPSFVFFWVGVSEHFLDIFKSKVHCSLKWSEKRRVYNGTLYKSLVFGIQRKNYNNFMKTMIILLGSILFGWLNLESQCSCKRIWKRYTTII